MKLRLTALVLFFASFTTTFSASALAVPPESTTRIAGATFSYYGSHSLTDRNAAIEQAIIVVHGSERNADTYYRSIETVAAQLGKSESTLIISPHYKVAGDALQADELAYTHEGWLRGDRSVRVSGTSSFEVIDYFVRKFGDVSVFPNLKSITLTGHSAGGQLTQRYAVGSPTESLYPTIRFRYLVLNPGSYVYLTPNRPVGGASGPYTVPRTNCAYDDYKYGLKKTNAYMSQMSIANMTSTYVARDVTYLLGELDTRADDIDQDCPARFQGNTRLERGKLFKAQLDVEFSRNRHGIEVVPGVGHTQWGIYTSPVGVKALFPN